MNKKTTSETSKGLPKGPNFGSSSSSSEDKPVLPNNVKTQAPLPNPHLPPRGERNKTFSSSSEEVAFKKDLIQPKDLKPSGLPVGGQAPKAGLNTNTKTVAPRSKPIHLTSSSDDDQPPKNNKGAPQRQTVQPSSMPRTRVAGPNFGDSDDEDEEFPPKPKVAPQSVPRKSAFPKESASKPPVQVPIPINTVPPKKLPAPDFGSDSSEDLPKRQPSNQPPTHDKSSSESSDDKLKPAKPNPQTEKATPSKPKQVQPAMPAKQATPLPNIKSSQPRSEVTAKAPSLEYSESFQHQGVDIQNTWDSLASRRIPNQPESIGQQTPHYSYNLHESVPNNNSTGNASKNSDKNPNLNRNGGTFLAVQGQIVDTPEHSEFRESKVEESVVYNNDPTSNLIFSEIGDPARSDVISMYDNSKNFEVDMMSRNSQSVQKESIETTPLESKSTSHLQASLNFIKKENQARQNLAVPSKKLEVNIPSPSIGNNSITASQNQVPPHQTPAHPDPSVEGSIIGSERPVERNINMNKRDQTFEESLPELAPKLVVQSYGSSMTNFDITFSVEALLKMAITCKTDLCSVLKDVCKYNIAARAHDNKQGKNDVRKTFIQVEQLFKNMVPVIRKLYQNKETRDSLKVLFRFDTLMEEFENQYTSLAQRLINDEFPEIINSAPGIMAGITFNKITLTKIGEYCTNPSGPKSLARLFYIHALCNQPKDKELKDAHKKSNLKFNIFATQALESMKIFKGYFGSESGFKVFIKAAIQAESIGNTANQPIVIEPIIRDMVKSYKKEAQIEPIQAVLISDSRLDKLKNEYIPNLLEMITDDSQGEKVTEYFKNSSTDFEKLKVVLNPMFADAESAIKLCFLPTQGSGLMLQLITKFKSNSSTKRIANQLAEAYIRPMFNKLKDKELSADLARQIIDNPKAKELVRKHLEVAEISDFKPDEVIASLKTLFTKYDDTMTFLENLRNTTLIPSDKKTEFQYFLTNPMVSLLFKIVEFREFYPALDKLISADLNLGVLSSRVEGKMSNDPNNMANLNNVISVELQTFKATLNNCISQITADDYKILYETVRNSKEHLENLVKLASPALSENQLNNIYLNMSLWYLAIQKDQLKSMLDTLENEFCTKLGIEVKDYSAHLDVLTVNNNTLKQTEISKALNSPLAQLAPLIFNNLDFFRNLNRVRNLLIYFKSKVPNHFEAMELYILEIKTNGYRNEGPDTIMSDTESAELLKNIQIIKKLKDKLVVNATLNLAQFADLLLNSNKAITSELASLGNWEVKLQTVSRDAGNRNSQDFQMVSNVTLDSKVEVKVDPKTGNYECSFIIRKNQKDERLSEADLRQLMASLKQLCGKSEEMDDPNKAKPEDNVYKVKFDDLTFILSTVDSIKSILDDLQAHGALLTLKSMIDVKGVTVGDNSLTISITKEIDANKTRKITLFELCSKLKEIKQNIEAEEAKISNDSEHNWILRVHGLQKIALANAIKTGQMNSDKIKRILKFVFNEAKNEQIFTEIPNAASFAGCNTTNEILKRLTLSAKITGLKRDKPQGNNKIHFGGFGTNKYDSLFAYMYDKKVENFSPMQFLLLNGYTREQEITSFLQAAFSDQSSSHYFVMDFHLLQPNLRDLFIRIVKKKLNDRDKDAFINTNIMIFVAYKHISQVYKELGRYKDYVQEFSLSYLTEQSVGDAVISESILARLPGMKTTIVDSELAGLGKSHYIRRQAQNAQKVVSNMILSGEISEVGINKRLELIKDSLTLKSVLSIKLDMMENMVENIELVDQQLFKICVLKCIKYDDSFLFFDNVHHFYIEISNNYRNTLLSGVPFLSFIQGEPHKKKLNKYTIPPVNFDDPQRFTFDVNYQIKLNTICQIHQLKTSGKYKDRNLMEETENEKQKDLRIWPMEKAALQTESVDYLAKQSPPSQNTCIDILKQICLLREPGVKNALDRDLKNVTMSQVTTLISALYVQLMGFECVPALNPQQTDHPPTLAALKNSRTLIVDLIFQLSNHLAWSKVQQSRAEAAQARKALQNFSTKLTFDDTARMQLEIYKVEMKSIPAWTEHARFNLFIVNLALKVIYQELKDVPKDIQDIIAANFTGLKDYKSMPDAKEREKALINELKEAFNVRSDEKFLKSLGWQEAWKLDDLAKWKNETLKPLNDDSKKEVELKTKLAKDIQDLLNQKPKSTLPDAFPLLIEYKIAKFGRGKSFSVNLDNYLKMLVIFARVQAGLPAVIIGATGCGKTYLVRFLVEVILNERFIELCMHSGITETNLEDTIEEAVNAARARGGDQPSKVWIFFDEFNTSPLQSLIEEIMTSRTANFSPRLKRLYTSNGKLPENLAFVAACNPCKIKAQATSVGLVHESTRSVFAHRVFPIPETLMNYSFDYGQLTPENKAEYIQGILGNLKIPSKDRLIECIKLSQKHITEIENESSVSLRDVTRVSVIYEWLNTFLIPMIPNDAALLDDLVLVCTTYICYIIRAGQETHRGALDKELCKQVKFSEAYVRTVGSATFAAGFKYVTNQIIQDIKRVGGIKPDVSTNRALRENIFAVVVGIATRVPIMIIGKPGTSKTLSISLLREFLINEAAKRNSKYFQAFPQTIFKEFCGSQITTSGDIQNHVDSCKELASRNPKNTIVFLFDEMGLAEIGYDNSLKILHPILEPKDNPLFAFIGLSNWLLDLSKMSRAVFVPRPNPELNDLIEIVEVQEIEDMTDVEHREILKRLVAMIPKTYIDFVTNEGQVFETTKENMEKAIDDNVGNKSKPHYVHENFFGLRDLYHFSKYAQRHVEYFSKLMKKKISNKEFSSEFSEKAWFRFVILGIFRNFSGKSSIINKEAITTKYSSSAAVFRKLYERNLQSQEEDNYNFKPLDLMNQCLIDKGSRHLMIFADKSSLVDMISNQLVEFFTRDLGYNRDKILYLNKDDSQNTEKIVQNLEAWISDGYVLIMKDLDDVYSSLYDILNQKYFTKNEEGDEYAMLQFGSARKPQDVLIHPKFRAIILMNRVDSIENMQEKKHPPPFLNRCEKHLIQKEDLISEDLKKLIGTVTNDMLTIFKASDFFIPQTLIHNFGQDIIEGLIIETQQNVTQLKKNNLEIYFNAILNNIRVMENKPAEANETKNSTIIKSINDKLVPFFSRNMLLALQSKNQLYADLQKKFKATHPYDSITELYKGLKAGGRNKSLVYTFSGAIELEESLETPELKDITSRISIDAILEVVPQDRQKYIQAQMDRYNLLVINIVGINTWANTEIIRSLLKDTNIIPGKAAIVVLQYSSEDLIEETADNNQPVKVKKEIDNWVGYEAAGWQVIVIDDLRDSCYKWFVDSLQMQYFQVVKGSNVLKLVIIKEISDRLQSTNDVPQELVSAIQDCVQKRAEKNPKYDEVFSKRLMSKKDNFKNNRDSLLVVQQMMHEDFERDVKEVLDKIGDAASYHIVQLSNLFSDKVKKELASEWIISAKQKANEIDQPVAAGTNVMSKKSHEERQKSIKYTDPTDSTAEKDLHKTIGQLIDKLSTAQGEEEVNQSIMENKQAYSHAFLKALKKWESDEVIKTDAKSAASWDNLAPVLTLVESMTFFKLYCDSKDVKFNLIERQIIAHVSEHVIKDINDNGEKPLNWKQTLMLPVMVAKIFQDRISFLSKTCKIEDADVDSQIIEKYLKGDDAGIPMGNATKEKINDDLLEQLGKLNHIEDLKIMREKFQKGAKLLNELQDDNAVSESKTYSSLAKIFTEISRQDKEMQEALTNMLKVASLNPKKDPNFDLIKNFAKELSAKAKTQERYKPIAQKLMSELLNRTTAKAQDDLAESSQEDIVTMYMEILKTSDERLSKENVNSLANSIVNQLKFDGGDLEGQPSKLFKTFTEHLADFKNSQNLEAIVARIEQLLVDKINVQGTKDSMFKKKYKSVQQLGTLKGKSSDNTMPENKKLSAEALQNIAFIIKHVNVVESVIMNPSRSRLPIESTIIGFLRNQLKQGISGKEKDHLAGMLMARICRMARGNYNLLNDKDMDVLSKEVIKFAYKVKIYKVEDKEGAVNNPYSDLIEAVNTVVLDKKEAGATLPAKVLAANGELLKNVLQACREEVTLNNTYVNLICANVAALSAAFADSELLNLTKNPKIIDDQTRTASTPAQGLLLLVRTFIEQASDVAAEKITASAMIADCTKRFQEVATNFFECEEHLALAVNQMIQIIGASDKKDSKQLSGLLSSAAEEFASIDSAKYGEFIQEELAQSTEFSDDKKDSLAYELGSMGLLPNMVVLNSSTKLIAASLMFCSADAEKCKMLLKRNRFDDFNSKVQLANFLTVVSQKGTILQDVQTLIVALVNFHKSLNLSGYSESSCKNKKLSDIITELGAKDKQGSALEKAHKELRSAWKKYTDLANIFFPHFEEIRDIENFLIVPRDQMKADFNRIIDTESPISDFVVNEQGPVKDNYRIMIMPSIIRNLVEVYNQILASIAPVIYQQPFRNHEDVENFAKQQAVKFTDVSESTLLYLNDDENAGEKKSLINLKSITNLLQESLQRNEDNKENIELNDAAETNIDNIIERCKEKVRFIKLPDRGQLVITKFKGETFSLTHKVPEMFKNLKDSKMKDSDKWKELNALRQNLNYRTFEDLENLDNYLMNCLENQDPTLRIDVNTVLGDIDKNINRDRPAEFRFFEKIPYRYIWLLLVAIRSTRYNKYMQSTIAEYKITKCEFNPECYKSLKAVIDSKRDEQLKVEWLKRLSMDVDFLKTLFIMTLWESRKDKDSKLMKQYMDKIQIGTVYNQRTSTTLLELFNKRSIDDINKLGNQALESVIATGVKFLDDYKKLLA